MNYRCFRPNCPYTCRKLAVGLGLGVALGFSVLWKMRRPTKRRNTSQSDHKLVNVGRGAQSSTWGDKELGALPSDAELLEASVEALTRASRESKEESGLSISLNEQIYHWLSCIDGSPRGMEAYRPKTRLFCAQYLDLLHPDREPWDLSLDAKERKDLEIAWRLLLKCKLMSPLQRTAALLLRINVAWKLRDPERMAPLFNLVAARIPGAPPPPPTSKVTAQSSGWKRWSVILDSLYQMSADLMHASGAQAQGAAPWQTGLHSLVPGPETIGLIKVILKVAPLLGRWHTLRAAGDWLVKHDSKGKDALLGAGSRNRAFYDACKRPGVRDLTDIEPPTTSLRFTRRRTLPRLRIRLRYVRCADPIKRQKVLKNFHGGHGWRRITTDPKCLVYSGATAAMLSFSERPIWLVGPVSQTRMLLRGEAMTEGNGKSCRLRQSEELDLKNRNPDTLTRWHGQYGYVQQEIPPTREFSRGSKPAAAATSGLADEGLSPPVEVRFDIEIDFEKESLDPGNKTSSK